MNSPNESDGMSGREPSLEILPRTPLHSIPVAGDLGQAPSVASLSPPAAGAVELLSSWAFSLLTF
uniref:Histone deacetylase 5 n=1 Tax=Mus musculus TaxID=10090 RepID=D6RH93_MOUSE